MHHLQLVSQGRGKRRRANQVQRKEKRDDNDSHGAVTAIRAKAGSSTAHNHTFGILPIHHYSATVQDRNHTSPSTSLLADFKVDIVKQNSPAHKLTSLIFPSVKTSPQCLRPTCVTHLTPLLSPAARSFPSLSVRI